jgi:hypothetical protein
MLDRSFFGLPAEWGQVSSWMSQKALPDMPTMLAKPELAKKCQEVPTLLDYRRPPPPGFWDVFPSSILPEDISTPVNIERMEALVQEAGVSWTGQQLTRSSKAIRDQKEGASAFQKKPLPPICVGNAKSSHTHGEMITDTLAAWTKSGIIKGPFIAPPVQNFRSNSIMAVDQKDKVRLVMDMSRPEGRSFNSNLTKHLLDKVDMSTARRFGYTAKEAGMNAIMSKLDMKDAYKLVPARKQDWRLQGMAWLGRYFIDLKETFGGTPSVTNYDALAATVQDLAIYRANVPRRWVHRTLDDSPVVSPAKSGWTLVFTQAYLDICKELNIPLAQPCSKKEKAFCNETKGRVLGIWFDTTDLSWSYPNDKLVPLVRDILGIVKDGTAGLKQMQSIMGSLNDVAQMCPFLKGWRMPSLTFQTSFRDREDITLPVPDQVKTDMLVCCRVVMAAGGGLPLASRPAGPALNYIKFTSDAAGAQTALRGGKTVNIPSLLARGAASVGLDEDEQIIFVSRITWPLVFLNEEQDEKGSFYGSKSTTLETIGAMLPFLSCPSDLSGRHIVLALDCTSVIYGWDKRQSSGDTAASILLRALHLISSYLACQIHMVHLPRRTGRAGILTDDLSREETTSGSMERRVRAIETMPRSPALREWLQNPTEDWSLADKILQDVITMCTK